MSVEINDLGEVTREIKGEKRWVGKISVEGKEGEEKIFFENCSFRLYLEEMKRILQWVSEQEQELS